MSMLRRASLISVLMLGYGCVPHDAYVAVDYVPENYAYYPHTYYDGQVTYYVDGRWYTRRGRDWVYFRDEPPELYEYRRQHVVERASPAYRDGHDYGHVHHEHHGHHAHGGHSAPSVIEAPPADRAHGDHVHGGQSRSVVEAPPADRAR
jgi:hypothetical protein